MGAFRVLLLTFVFVFSICEASPVARNTFRSVIDQYIENATAAEIIADALVVALKENRTPLENVRYDVGASAPQAVVSVEVNDVSSEVPSSGLELKAAAERLSEMKAKQKLVSIEILKVNEGGTSSRPKKIRKIRRRKLVTKGSLRLRTTQPPTTGETFTPTEASSSEAFSEAPTTAPAITETSPSVTDTVTKAIAPSIETTTTINSSAVPSVDETTIATSAPSESPANAQNSTSSERATTADNNASSNLVEDRGRDSSQTEFVNGAADGQDTVSEVITSTPVSTPSTDPSVTTENIPAVQDSTTVQGLHADKINVENEVLASATHEQPAFTTEMPSTMEVKKLKVVSPTGDSHEVKVLSSVRRVADVDLSNVHMYPKVPLLNEKSQVAVDIGGLRYRQSPRRIKIKVPKGGDTANIQPPRGYSLLRAEPTASASHEEFTFVREQTTVPASTSTSASIIEATTEIPKSAGSPIEETATPPSAVTDSAATTIRPEAVETQTPAASTEQTTQSSSSIAETTTTVAESSSETVTTTARPLPSTEFTNFLDLNTEVSVATSISAVESTTEPVRATTSAPLPDLLKDLGVPADRNFQSVIDADNQRTENATETDQSDQHRNIETVQDVVKPEQVTEDWITTSADSTPAGNESTAATEPPVTPALHLEINFDQPKLENTDSSSSEVTSASPEVATVFEASTQTPETSSESATTTSPSSAEERTEATTAVTETETVTDAGKPIGADSPFRSQVIDNSRVESDSGNLSETLDESNKVVGKLSTQLNSEETPESARPITPEQTSDVVNGDNHTPAPPQNEPENTSAVKSVPSDVPQDVPGNIPTPEAVTEPARNEATSTSDATGAGQQISDDKSIESLLSDQQDPPKDLPRRQDPTETAAVSSDSDERIEVQEELIVPQRYPEFHDADLKTAAPESKESSEEPSSPATPGARTPDASLEELDSTTPSPTSGETTESSEVSSEIRADFKDEDGKKTSTSSAEEEEVSKPELAPIPMTVVPSAPPEPSAPKIPELPHRMIVLDRMNVPVLPFGGNRFAELGLQKADDGSMKMVINDVMAIIREQDMAPSSGEEPRNSEEQSSDEVTPPPPILSQPKNEPPRSIVTQVPRIGSQNKILMPDAPTIIMQIPANSPQAKFSLRRIPGHINVPSVYEILDPERRNPVRSTPQIENGRAIVTLPLLPLRALPPIQQNYYRYNRLPGQGLQTPQQQQPRQQQFSAPQTFFPQDVYPQQFQTSFPPNYERLFPQSYPNQQGNLFYINTKRRSR